MTTRGEQANEREFREPPRPPPDAAAWDKAAADAAVAQLTSVRSTAEKWAGTVTALLGVFSTVAVVTGTDVLKDISSEGVRQVLIGLIVVAGLAAGASIYFAANAAQGSITLMNNWNGSTYRAAVNAKTSAAVGSLKQSRIAGIVAASLVFVVGVVSLIAAAIPEASSKQKVLVIGEGGILICGEAQADAGGRVKIGEQSITGATQIMIVTKC